MSDERIVTRQQALLFELKRYFTGDPCVHGHVAQRYTSNSHCTSCTSNAGYEKFNATKKPYDPVSYCKVTERYRAVDGTNTLVGYFKSREEAVSALEAIGLDQSS